MTPDVLFQQALTLHQAGKLAEAERLYAQILQLLPQNYPALHLMGVLRQQQGATQEALNFFDRALAQSPTEPETLFQSSVALYALGRLLEALARVDRALVLKPDYLPAHNNRAAMLHALGRSDEALAVLERVTALSPGDARAHNNQGVILTALRRFEEAAASCDRAAMLEPNYLEAINNAGVALRELRRFQEALNRFELVIARNQGHAGAWSNRGSTLWDMDRIDEALESFDRAIALWPDFVEALHSRGEMRWSRKKDLAGAIADLEAMIRVRPDYPYALGTLMHLKSYAGDWRDYAFRKAELDAAVRAGKKAVVPFAYMTIGDAPSDLAACARLYAADKYPAEKPRGTPARRRKPGRIRIGYVCGEFRQQATSYLMAGVYDHHDKNRFEIFAFDNGYDDGSPLRRRMAAAFDKIIPIAALSAREAAMRVRDEEIDILVNLNGYYGALRMDLFAHRPAPIQVNYLGFPGTLGADYIDYLIADRVVIPQEDRGFYNEQVIWLPHCYQANDDSRVISAPPSRADAGLPGDGPGKAFVFCHFNYSYKLAPATLASWMRILKRTPGSLLWLLESDPLFAQNIRRAAESAGVDSKRLILAPQLEHAEHLARLALGDLFLDSLPCNAHTTASDALWAGLPLVTCRGNAFPGRVAASLLKAAGLPDLIAETEAEFEDLAVALAADGARLVALRQRLAANRTSQPLFDTARYTSNLEAAYARMFEQGGEAPKAFAVDENGTAL